MRFLFIAYCFGDASGHAQIGVYKRGLRVALELQGRGHEVLLDCTGRTTYHDDQTALAEQRLQFVELHLDALHDDGLKRSRERALAAMAGCRPDLVVVCEAPQVGTLLEGTLCAVELGIPVALLDNAYHPLAVPLYLWNHGGMMDGVVLNGPTCVHMRRPPPHVLQVSPYLTSDRAKAAELLQTLGLRSERLVCVPAYDPKVERLGFSLLERLPVTDADFLFMSRDLAGLEQKAAQLPEGVRQRVRTSGLLPDPVLFGLLELSRLAVIKCGFMQATECLSLRTPVICAYQGTHWFRTMPSACRQFIHVVDDDEADPATVAAAVRFLDLPEQAMRSIHAGGFDASVRAAEFLEALPAEQRSDARAEAAEKFPEKQVRSALRSAFGRRTVTIRLLRAMRLRAIPGEEVYSLVCRCTIDGDERFLRLWGRRYAAPWGVRRGRREAVHAGRRVLFASPRRRLLIEADAGQAELPSLVF